MQNIFHRHHGPTDLWVRCGGCHELIYRREFENNLHTCPKCSFHERIGSTGGKTGPDDAILQAVFARTGAYVMGRRMFDEDEVGWPENSFTGVGWDQGGYHRSHGQHVDGSGAYTVRRAEHWVFEGTGLKDGDTFGGADTIVGYETDGCLYEERDGLPRR